MPKTPEPVTGTVAKVATTADRKRTSGPNRTHCKVPLPLMALDRFLASPEGDMADKAKALDKIERVAADAAKKAGEDLVAGWMKTEPLSARS